MKNLSNLNLIEFPFSHFSLDTESGEHSNMPALPWFHTDVEKENKYKNQSKTSDDNSVASQGKLKKATIKQEKIKQDLNVQTELTKAPKSKDQKQIESTCFCRRIVSRFAAGCQSIGRIWCCL